MKSMGETILYFRANTTIELISDKVTDLEANIKIQSVLHFFVTPDFQYSGKFQLSIISVSKEWWI